eukprot:793221-Prymnesium_polylepis.1
MSTSWAAVLGPHKEADPRAVGWLLGVVSDDGRCSPLASLRCVQHSQGLPDWSAEPKPPAELVPSGLSVVGLYAACDGTSPAADQLTSLLAPHAVALKAALAPEAWRWPLVAGVSASEVAFFE